MIYFILNNIKKNLMILTFPYEGSDLLNEKSIKKLFILKKIKE
jgi:hypothetical protein